MAIVLTNGFSFITTSKTGGIKKTSNIMEAQTFYSFEVAIKKKNKAPGKCRSYYPYDTDNCDNTIIDCNHEKKKKKNRKKYSATQRKIIYDKAEGHCQLCGRKILFTDMTLDHIIPLDYGGEDTMENLQLSCAVCNRFKANILPEQFFDRITEIFIYQMEKKYGDNNIWKMIHSMLLDILI